MSGRREARDRPPVLTDLKRLPGLDPSSTFAVCRFSSLTVTESNAQAIELYMSEGYVSEHIFDAAVWQRAGQP